VAAELGTELMAVPEGFAADFSSFLVGMSDGFQVNNGHAIMVMVPA
jgi:hypothetical protein